MFLFFRERFDITFCNIKEFFPHQNRCLVANTMLFCSFEARYRVINGRFRCLIPRRWRHWLLSSRTLISASTRSPHIFWSKHLLNSSQKQVCFFGFDTFTNNYAVCSSLCKESQFCVCVNRLHILSILSDHACISRSFMCMPLGTSDVL